MNCMICYADVGDLRIGEFDRDLADSLIRERVRRSVRIAREERLIAAEDAGRYRDALGAMPPSGLPEVFLESVDEPLRSLVARFARSRGPFTTAEANERFGRDVEPELRALEREDKLVRGELRPGGTEREWCDPDVLRRLRRASLAALRKEVEPAEQATLGRFLPSWHGIDRRATLREALVPLQALSLPVALWESDVLPRRVPGYRPELLDQLCATGEVVWVGAGLDRVALFFREDASVLGRPSAAPPPEGEEHDRIRDALGSQRRVLVRPARGDRPRGRAGAARALGPGLGRRGDERRLAAAPVATPQRGAATRAQAPAVLALAESLADTATQGRWSLADRLFTGDPDRRALAELLLERQGIVTRDGVRGEGIAGGYGAVYGELKALETLGLCRRGYFVEGLGGAQFALGGAVERLRELRPREDDEREPLVLAAADPGPTLRRRAAVAEAGRRESGSRRGRVRRPARRASGALRRARREVDGAAARIPTRSGSGSRWPRSSTTRAGTPASASRSSASTASRSPRASRCRSSSRPASSPAPAARSSGRSILWFRPARDGGSHA